MCAKEKPPAPKRKQRTFVGSKTCANATTRTRSPPTGSPMRTERADLTKKNGRSDDGGADGRRRRVPPFSTAAFSLFSPSSSFTPTQNSSRRNVRGDSSGSYFFPADSSFPECAKVSLYFFLLLVRRRHLSLFFSRGGGAALAHSFTSPFLPRKERPLFRLPRLLPPPPPPALAKAKARLKASLGCTHRHFPPPLIDFFRATTNSGLKPPPPPSSSSSLFYCGSSGGRRSPSTTIAFTAKALSLSLSLYLSQPSFTSCSSFSLPTTTTLRINKTRRWSGGAARSSSSSSSTLASLFPPAPLPQVTSMQVEGGREGCAFVLLLLLRQRERGKKGGDTPFFQPLSLLSRGCCLARSV